MGLIEDDFLRFIEKMKDLGELNQEKPNSSTQKDNLSLPLSKIEIKAFEGLCAIEGKSVKDKVAELIKNYLGFAQKVKTVELQKVTAILAGLKS